jgi:hypothetical protein
MRPERKKKVTIGTFNKYLVEKNTKLPWEGLKIKSNSNGNIGDIIKEEILALSAVTFLKCDNFRTKRTL